MKIKQFEAYNGQGVNVGKAIQARYVDTMLRVVVDTLVNGTEQKQLELAIQLNKANLNIRQRRKLSPHAHKSDSVVTPFPSTGRYCFRTG